jgi:hypothetical protein
MLARDRIDMTLTKLKLAQIPHKSEPPPYGFVAPENSCSGTRRLTACTSFERRGNIKLVGGARDHPRSLAELIGVDLRGLGLTLTQSNQTPTYTATPADLSLCSR